MKNENSPTTTRPAPLRIQTGVRAGSVRLFFGRVQVAIFDVVGGSGGSSGGTNAVGGVRG